MKMKLTQLASLCITGAIISSTPITSLAQATNASSALNQVAQGVKERLEQGVINIPSMPSAMTNFTELKKLRVTVSTGLDPTWRIVSAAVSGGELGSTPNSLKTRALPSGSILRGEKYFEVEMPTSLYPGKDVPYTLTVTAKDVRGNTESITKEFYYSPDELEIQYVSDGTLKFPYSEKAISNALVIKEVPSTSVNEIYVHSAPSSTATIEVAGHVIRPGQRVRVASRYKPSATEGHVKLDMAVYGTGVAKFYVDMGAGMPVASSKATVFKPVITESVSSLTPSVLEDVTLSVKVDGCNLIDPETESQNTTEKLMTGQADCLISWVDNSGTLTPTGTGVISGQILTQEPLEVLYLIGIDNAGKPNQQTSFFGLGPEDHVVQVGDFKINPTPLRVPLEVASQEQLVAPIKVDAFDISVTSSGCETTIYNEGAKYSANQCVVDVVSSPVKLSDSVSTTATGATFSGVLSNLGENEFVFKAGKVAKNGSLVWSDETFTTKVNGVEPPDPEVLILGNVFDTTPNAFSVNVPAEPDATANVLSLSTSSKYPVHIKVTDAKLLGNSEHKSITTSSAAIQLASKNFTLFDTATVNITASYVNYPEKKSSQTVTVLQLPTENVDIKASAPLSTYDLNSYPVAINFGVGGGSRGYAYESSTMGNWDLDFGVMVDGEFSPVTNYGRVTTNSFSHKIDPAQLKQIAAAGNLHIRAVLDSPIAGFEKTIYEKLEVPEIKPIVPVVAQVLPKSSFGAAPLLSKFTATLDPASADQLGGITWERSNDGVNWVSIPNATDQSYSNTYAAGKYYLRAILSNKFAEERSIAAHVTDPVTVNAFTDFNIGIESNQFVFVGDTLPMKAVATAAKQGDPKPENINFTWTYTSGQTGEVVTFTGEEFNLRELKRGNYTVTTIGIPDGVNEQEFSGKSVSTVVAVDIPSKVGIGFSGSGGAEVGRDNLYKASVSGPWRTKTHGYNIIQSWTLPNGLTVNDPNLLYKPTEDILIDGGNVESYVDLVHTAYVEGYESATTRQSTKRVRVWKYEWPEFNLSFKSKHTSVPSEVTVEFKPTDATWYRRTYHDPIVYDYGFPEGVEIIEQNKQRLIVRITQEGSVNFTARASDHLGNVKEGSKEFDLLPTPPFRTILSATASNKHYRAPFALTGRLSVTDGHPDDSIATINWSLDGQNYPELSGVTRPEFPVTTPGIHKLEAHVVSTLGTIAKSAIDVEAFENKIPTCTIALAYSNTSVTATANCPDEDGYITNYRWVINGVESSLTGYRISFARPSSGASFPISVTATDDSGAQVTVNQTIQ